MWILPFLVIEPPYLIDIYQNWYMVNAVTKIGKEVNNGKANG